MKSEKHISCNLWDKIYKNRKETICSDFATLSVNIWEVFLHFYNFHFSFYTAIFKVYPWSNKNTALYIGPHSYSPKGRKILCMKAHNWIRLIQLHERLFAYRGQKLFGAIAWDSSDNLSDVMPISLKRNWGTGDEPLRPQGDGAAEWVQLWGQDWKLTLKSDAPCDFLPPCARWATSLFISQQAGGRKLQLEETMWPEENVHNGLCRFVRVARKAQSRHSCWRRPGAGAVEGLPHPAAPGRDLQACRSRSNKDRCQAAVTALYFDRGWRWCFILFPL